MPDITLHRSPGRVNRGFGVNVILEFISVVRTFARLGWSDGDLEGFAFTEVENTIELGAGLKGSYWRRPTDRIRVAFVSNDISNLHREYLRLGGLGFPLEDGNLNCSRETIVRVVLHVDVDRGLSFADGHPAHRQPGCSASTAPSGCSRSAVISSSEHRCRRPHAAAS